LKTEYYAVVILISSLAIAIGTVSYINAQSTQTQKAFYLGTNPVGVLDDFLYPSGDQISYDIAGYPPITITVHKWNELSTVQQTQITVRLQTMGYIEGEETITGLLK